MTLRKLAVAVIATTAISLSLAAPAGADHADAWGAIAVNLKSGKVGIGFGEPSKKKAKREAERDCEGKCRQILIVRNKCGVLGINGKGRFVAGFDRKKKEAKEKAAKRIGPDGKLIALVCSG